MTEVRVLLNGVDHLCCGQLRSVGEMVTLSLTLSKTGVVMPTQEPDRVVMLPDESALIVGTVAGVINGDCPEWDGTVIASDGLRFAIWGKAPAHRVSCVGEVVESRHDEPSALTTGELVKIEWMPEPGISSSGENLTGYGLRTEVQSTRDAPSGHSWLFVFTIRVP